MRVEEALSYAEELGCIPRFPWGNGPAVAKVAEVIAQICPTADDAHKLVTAAVESMTEWSGIPTLRAIWAGMRAERDETWHDLGPRPPKNCERCSDLGWVAENNRPMRCSCETARLVTEEELAQLDKFYERKSASQNSELKVIRQKPQKPSTAELESMLAAALGAKGRAQV